MELTKREALQVETTMRSYILRRREHVWSFGTRYQSQKDRPYVAALYNELVSYIETYNRLVAHYALIDQLA